MTRWLLRLAKWSVVTVLVLVAAVVGVRMVEAYLDPELQLWHTFIPDELTVGEIDAADWDAYLRAEDRVMAAVRREVTDVLPDAARTPGNRYWSDSPLYPGSFATDWNRSYLAMPVGQPRGAVVLLHGMTDAPYSLRHIGDLYRNRGFVVVSIRMPGHGTVPAGMTAVGTKEWQASTRLAVRTASARIGVDQPLHIVGYSKGAALALTYALEALDQPLLRRPQQIVLLSPMVGVTAFARFAGLAGLPAYLPGFVRAAWLDVAAEFNPFKYNSFPVRAARESHELASTVQRGLSERARRGGLADFPPVLTFQSVVDFTVSTPAVINALHATLPAGRSELVLFDINRATKLGPLLRASAATAVERLLPPAPRGFTATTVTTRSDSVRAAEARSVAGGDTAETVQALGIDYPRDLFSLSHLALPFPDTDGLYGATPDPQDHFGANLGAVAPRGEIGVLVMSLDTILRAASNPFYPYVAARIDETIPAETADRPRPADGTTGQ